MKIAIMSDIHRNVFTLSAVITDAKTHQVDVMVNLGDILYCQQRVAGGIK